MDSGLAGKRVLITGGTRGIGKATMLAFARAGASVVTCHRTPGPAVDHLAKELVAIGADYRIVTADVTTADDVARLAAECGEAFGGIDVLVNNVGIDGTAALESLTLDVWQHMFDHNITSAYLVTSAVAPLMGAGAAIVNVASAAAARGRPAAAHYSASKAAMLGFTRGLCKELGPRGIRVNAVEPGFLDSGEFDRTESPQLVERLRAMTPLGRLCTPEDVAGVIGFLAGPAAEFITGQAIRIDGGM
ncbi:SDR family NAD(P)-dependent oxidoreductase [Nocardia salmonicida]|uniref:SDR family NAD(P)-dependent oxidoreductase n=1 Tax=Nocardia salmonicida TaxID=53431 RepID=UPI003CF8D6EB